MSRTLGFLIALMGIVGAAVATPAAAGELRREAVASSVLKRDFPFVVYLPDGYAGGQDRYPVLYLLHGAGGDENAWSVEGEIKEHADRLIASGVIPPAIIVMPGCRGCWWIDGTKDKAETAFWKDLVPAVGRRYRTIEHRNGRVIAGLSAGGYGALRLALKYPDKFCAVAGLSPAIYATAPPAISSARDQHAFVRTGGKFDLASWRSHNYPKLLPAYVRQKQRVPMYLVSGDHDKYGIAFETALFFKTMFERQPEQVELRVVDGDHSWAVWRNSVDNALTYVFRFVSKPPALIADTPRKPAPQQFARY